MEVARRRTRKQWDDYYKQLHDELKQKKKDDGVEALRKNDVDDDDNGDGVETLKSDGEDDDGVEALKKNDGMDVDDDDDDSIEFLGASIEKQRYDDGVDVDDDDGVEALKSDDVNSIEFLGASIEKQRYDDGVDVDDGDGVEALKSDDVNSIEFLGASIEKQKNDDVVDVDDDDDGVQALKSGEDEDDDGNSIEFLGVKEKNDDGVDVDVDVDDEAESRSKVGDLSEGVGNRRVEGLEADSLVESEPQLHRDVSVDSDSYSEEDSDESVSESEPTSEGGDELFDEDYKGNESSISESSDDSEDEEQKDDEYGVDETENLMNMADGKTAFATHGESSRMRENMRRESDTKDDQRSSDCEIGSHDHESNCEILTGNVNEKLFRFRKRRRMNMERESGADLETNDEKEKVKEKEKEKLPKIKKNRKVDETHKSHNKETEHRKCSSSATIESASSKDNENDEGYCFYTRVKRKGQQCSVKKVMMGKKRSHSARGLDLIKILVDSMNSFKEKQYNMDENALAENALPLRFRFEDEVLPPPEKSEMEEHIDSLFRDLELGLRETEADCTNLYTMENDDLKTTAEIDESPAACCRRGKHHAILDEQIGIICKYCHTVIMDIKHVLPPFHIPTWEGRDRRYYRDEFPSSYFSEIKFGNPASTTPDSTSCTKGTVWDLVAGVEKELYPHQREGFEFMWRNIAGDTIIEKLKHTLADDAKGCIISHAPGTGKTRLTIVFLQTFLKLYPACSPMIIAPRGMLLTWEAEFKKWNFNVAFHNLNKKELSGKENAVATELLGQVGSGILNRDCIRLLKLYSWARGGSILGIGYPLFEKLAGENGKTQQHEKIREVLLERPGLLVLDEGHTPRNDKSRIWKVLTKVSTQRRVILSGTPFQNNLKELYNTLCVVNPKFADQVVGHKSNTRAKWRNLTNSSGINKGHALKLRAVLDPFIHVHKGTVLEESLPGLRHTLVFLHATNSQKALLESACEEREVFRRIHMVSLVSLHPSINTVTERYSTRREEITTDIDAGVKARFLFKLIHFADALGERVLVFSQFIDSLIFIKEQLESIFSWNEGREVLYMDGQLDEKKRQDSISCFNDETSEAKVLLASVRACSEGINLIGASRVVLLDTVWNPSVEKQAISRAYRLGQKRVVYVYRLFTSGVEVRQYAQQNLKERISQWIFSLGEEGYGGKARAVSEDKVLEAMLNLENFNQIFEKIIYQPKESDLIKTFGLEEQK